MPKTDKEFRSMTKKELVEYTKSLEEKLEEINVEQMEARIKTLEDNLELTQEEAAGMSETIRLKNSKEAVTAKAIANFINAMNLATDNASDMLESIGVISKGGSK
jgi:ribosomal protein L29